jgi:hypothetical protein
MITFIKKLIIVVGCVLMLNPLSSNGQNSRSPMEDMVNAIRTNRAEDMVKYFDSFVPITINNNQAMYSHNQAEVVLKDFFERNNPKDFVVMDNGSPNNSSKFAIGAFTTPAGIKYNVYILMKLKDNSYMLQEIRLNKD